MPRNIEVTAPGPAVEEIVRRIADLDGVVGLARQPGASIRPAGDVLTIRTTNDASRQVLRIIEDVGIGDRGMVQTSEPRSVLVHERQEALDRESNETFWHEMAFLLRSDTNIGQNYLATMALAGAICAAGLWVDTLHLIIASMVIASAFEPLVRISFGLVAGPRSLVSTGFASTAAGYGVLAAGAAASLILLRIVDPGAGPDLEAREWVRYWTEVPTSGVIVALFAAAAGTVIVTGQRSVLTTGVMIALALIPSMSIAGMGVVSGDLELAGRGFLRWLVDAGVVLVVSAAVLRMKRAVLHRRRASE